MHANVEFVDFLTALEGITRVAAVIPKASSKKFANLDVLSAHFPVFDIDRRKILDRPDQFLSKIDLLTKNERFAIIDMGGYFSHVAINLTKKFNT